MTGSRVYGTPRDDSDYDMVIFVRERDFVLLAAAQGQSEETSAEPTYGDMASLTIRRGNLNLIVTKDPGLYDLWRVGTSKLKARAPVTREEAIKYLSAMRKKYWESKPRD